MSQPMGGMPGNYYAPPPMEPPGPKRNVVGLIALIVAVVGLFFACLPGALIIGWALLPIGFILGIVGVCLSGQKKATSIAAIITSIVGAVIGVVVFLAVVSDAFGDAFGGDDLSASSSSSRASTAPSAAPQPEDQQGSRTDPYPIGQTVSNAEWQITLGSPRQADAEIAAENQFNESPKPGMEFWIVPVSAVYTGDETGSLTYGVDVKFVGSDNRTYDDRCGVIPDPLTEVGDLYKGGTAQGNVCVTVPAGADGLWSLKTGFVGDPVFFRV